MDDTQRDRHSRLSPLAPEISRTDSKPAETEGLTAMVVDDDQIMLRLAANLLTHFGFGVSTAGGGKKALFEFQRWPCELLLTDYEMPAINGYQLSCRIKSRFPQTRAVVMTSNRRATVAELMNDSRIDGWLFKPFSRGELRDLLSRIGMPIEGRGAF